jgi:hypothetical protein
LRDRLTAWGIDGLEFAASQALSEVATNAVIHARTEFAVTIEWSDDVLRITVEDASRKLPIERHYAPDSTTGRGLALVALLSRAWGVERVGTGKQVWFEVVTGVGVGADDLEVGDDLDADALLAAFDDADDMAASGPAERAPLARVA